MRGWSVVVRMEVEGAFRLLLYTARGPPTRQLPVGRHLSIKFNNIGDLWFSPCGYIQTNGNYGWRITKIIQRFITEWKMITAHLAWSFRDCYDSTFFRRTKHLFGVENFRLWGSEISKLNQVVAVSWKSSIYATIIFSQHYLPGRGKYSAFFGSYFEVRPLTLFVYEIVSWKRKQFYLFHKGIFRVGLFVRQYTGWTSGREHQWFTKSNILLCVDLETLLRIHIILILSCLYHAVA